MLYEDLKNLVFPPRCIFCGEVSRGGAAVCRTCDAGSERYAKGYVTDRPEGRRYFDWAVAAYHYTGLAKQGITNFKFRGDKRGQQVFGHAIAEKLRELHLDRGLDCVAYVPMDEQRKKTRGYNQAELLAEQVAKELGLNMCYGVLRRSGVLIQHELTPGFRARSAQYAVEATESRAIRGMRVLLVDDIITTGMTVNSCAGILLEMGAESVSVAAIAC